ncbi:MAG: aldo/keto reductase [Tenacibaculum sp.]
MKYTYLANTDIEVSKICLGTMTWGNQNTEAQGHEQMNCALEQGVNFFDTAELYAVPASAETYGSTEKIIGSWFKKTKNRAKIILATKIAGTGDYTAHIRKDGFSNRALTEAVEGSLKRLQTNYIDLYQLHWPKRGVNCFGIRDYPYKTSSRETDNYAEILQTLNKFIKQGKIRCIGLSNETPWGTMKYLQTAELLNLQKPVSVQNSYSLIHRSYEYGMSEVSLRENIGLLAYSPLAFGVLSGKYLGGKKPDGARLTLFPRFNRYSSEQSTKAAMAYQKIAQKHGLSLAELSLAYINQLPFVTANIIGATKLHQLKENINSINITLSETVLNEIEQVHSSMPNPAP